MYNKDYEDIGTPEIIDHIDIFYYKRTFLRELADKEGVPRIRVNSDLEALRVKELMNIPENTTFKSLDDIRSGVPYWNYQEVDYVKSNLGKGYIFYFICNRCGRRVKFLYFYRMIEPPLCRTCCDMPYKQKTYKERKISRNLKNEKVGILI